ncbi:long-chain acyl-CoA synthetase [Pustulibacterium marinum]|uniref:Long-chain acyl-CoA synthetase n=1 Tax=Pustulibacterium marinum TaxID=1224947 RepID=A0A1I7HXB7_9FLAO|nr:AMP-dependent synthetase/ligase [Pustulibacterium marinum]SFU65126.1 long-chain acyl-CoA synthetase [Pustulibacterium marinum]
MTSISRIFDIPYYQKEHYNIDNAFAVKRNGNWIATSSSEYIAKANQISRALIAKGIQPNDKIAIITSTNRTEWHILDIGILQVGAQNIPIYPTISEQEYEYILNHSEAKICIVSDVEVLQKLKSIVTNTKVEVIYTLDEIEGELHWETLLTIGENTAHQEAVEQRKAAISEDDLATIIYTSGTTGTPKGVMLSHKNIVSDVLGSQSRVPLNQGNSRALSFLPICHVFERMVTYIYQYNGISIYFAESIDKMSENMKEVQPNVMTVVPRLLEKVYDKIYSTGISLTGIKKALFMWSVNLGAKFEPYGANGFWYELQLKIARKLIFSKWQAAFGGNIDILVSGSAALQPRLARLFGAAGLPVMEGYGLTETSPVIAVNDQRKKGWKIGTVGKMIPGVKVKIAEDGEILCKGPNIMMGYYKDEVKTKEVITDGYFHTGDIGEIDHQGFLKITDRKKEMFKTSGGKYVAPQIIENEMKQSRFIEQIMVIGEGEKMPAAFIQPNFEFVQEWAKRHNYSIGNTPSEISKNEKVIERINEEVICFNERFGKWEKVKAFELTPDIWSIDEGHLTPTLKLKRRIIKEKYKDLYDKIYNKSN